MKAGAPLHFGLMCHSPLPLTPTLTHNFPRHLTPTSCSPTPESTYHGTYLCWLGAGSLQDKCIGRNQAHSHIHRCRGGFGGWAGRAGIHLHLGGQRKVRCCKHALNSKVERERGLTLASASERSVLDGPSHERREMCCAPCGLLGVTEFPHLLLPRHGCETHPHPSNIVKYEICQFEIKRDLALIMSC